MDASLYLSSTGLRWASFPSAFCSIAVSDSNSRPAEAQLTYVSQTGSPKENSGLSLTRSSTASEVRPVCRIFVPCIPSDDLPTSPQLHATDWALNQKLRSSSLARTTKSYSFLPPTATPTAAAIALLALSLTRRMLVQLNLIITSMVMQGCSARASRHTTMFSLTRTTSRKLIYRVSLAQAYVIVYGTIDRTGFNHCPSRFATCMLAARGPYLSQPPCAVNTFSFLFDIVLVQTVDASVPTNQMRTMCAPPLRTTATLNKANNSLCPTLSLKQPLRRAQEVLQAVSASSFGWDSNIHMKTWLGPCTFAEQ